MNMYCNFLDLTTLISYFENYKISLKTFDYIKSFMNLENSNPMSC